MFQLVLEDFTFLLFLVLMVLFTVFTYFLVPETKGKTFEEIAHQFSPGGAIEVEEMLDDVFDDIPEANEAEDEAESRLVSFTAKPQEASPDEDKKDNIAMNDINKEKKV